MKLQKDHSEDPKSDEGVKFSKIEKEIMNRLKI